MASRTSSAPAAFDRYVIATSAPARATASAMARPIPLDPPVTSTARSVSVEFTNSPIHQFTNSEMIL
jgi:hypothetical protein